MLKQAEEHRKRERERKRETEKLLVMNLKLCVIHNHEATVLDLFYFFRFFYSQNRRGAC